MSSYIPQETSKTTKGRNKFQAFKPRALSTLKEKHHDDTDRLMGDFIEHSKISGIDSMCSIDSVSRNYNRRTTILDKTASKFIETQTPTILPSV